MEACFQEHVGAAPVKGMAAVRFNARGRYVGMRWPEGTLPESKCVERAMRTASAPCPAVPQSAALVTFEVSFLKAE